MIDPSDTPLQLDDFSKWIVLASLLSLYLESLVPIIGPLLFLIHSSLLSFYMFSVAEFHFIRYIIIYTLSIQSEEHASQMEDQSEYLSPENLLVYPFRRAYIHAIICFIGTLSSMIPLGNVFINLFIIVVDFANLVLL